ncbi:hypothetical protein EB54_02081 [Enterococcus gallinarum]|uniref:hypothetical protein n=1 Tax=Enterococcus gallinarum TaxID=1353 RepID=UPI000DFDA2E0|nr:hypothetical protein [Enterococcus gallinarum]RBT39399.1 hypothetical protein EB54_02081 [Enterococcus gallinarum]
MSDKLAVLMEFNGYTKDELEAYLSLKFGSMTKGGMTASILSQSGYEKAKSVIFGQPQLNENQQQVLGWLKEYYKENRPFTTAFGAIRNVASKRWAFIKQNLTEDQQEYVLEAFSRWAHEQEEE